MITLVETHSLGCLGDPIDDCGVLCQGLSRHR